MTVDLYTASNIPFNVLCATKLVEWGCTPLIQYRMQLESKEQVAWTTKPLSWIHRESNLQRVDT